MTSRQYGRVMQAEIHEQPQVITNLLAAERDRVWDFAAKWRAHPPRGIFIAARGTSDHAALYAKYVFETMNGIPVGLMAPSVATIYQAKVDVRDYLVIGISQSGEAADVIAALELANRAGGETLAITNVGNSPLAQAAQQTLELHAEPEVAVAATKTFTTTMAALLLLSAAMGDNAALYAELARVPELIADVLTQEATLRAQIAQFRYMQECVVLGRGYNMAVAYELALKLRETCYIRSQPFASPDFVHGPIAILAEGFPVIAFANDGPSLPSVLDVLRKTKARGADTIVIGNASEALHEADIALPVNQGQAVPEIISPFPAIVAGQLLAQGLSVLKGINPDKPRGLRKVTITR
ncbi:MAG TPA: SIS domain-containing protein [Armatimonadota bacterium]|jgi:glucosamine--fructose-6-phosphate aminotransferase (isomerizing)